MVNSFYVVEHIQMTR